MTVQRRPRQTARAPDEAPMRCPSCLSPLLWQVRDGVYAAFNVEGGPHKCKVNTGQASNRTSLGNGKADEVGAVPRPWPTNSLSPSLPPPLPPPGPCESETPAAGATQDTITAETPEPPAGHSARDPFTTVAASDVAAEQRVPSPASAPEPASPGDDGAGAEGIHETPSASPSEGFSPGVVREGHATDVETSDRAGGPVHLTASSPAGGPRPLSPSAGEASITVDKAAAAVALQELLMAGVDRLPEAKRDRRTGLGASDIFDVVFDPMRVWLKKVGLVPEEPESDLLAAGRYMEPGIARWFSDATGLILVGDGQTAVQHPTEPWAWASPDRFVLDADGRKVALVEIKNVGFYRADDWGEDATQIPLRVYFQCQFQMECTGLSVDYPAPLIGGNRPRFLNDAGDGPRYRIERDPDVGRQLVEVGRRFWHEHVLAVFPPEVDGRDSSRDYLRARFPKAGLALKAAPPDVAPFLGEFYQTREERLAYEKAEARLKHVICAAIGPDAGVEAPGYVATWATMANGSRKFEVKRTKEMRR